MIRISEKVEMSFIDFPDDKSWAINLYFLGCEYNCEGCHNPTLQTVGDNKYSSFFYIKDFFDLLSKYSEKYKTKCVNLLGGEPLSNYNLPAVKKILNYNYKHKLGFKFCIFTGDEIEECMDKEVWFFEYIKVGRYIKDKKLKKAGRCLGSSNQVVYDKNLKAITTDGIYNS